MGQGSTMYSPGGGGLADPSSGSGGFFSNIYQNIADTATVAAQSNEPSFWEKTLTQVGNIAATVAATKLQQAKNAGTTPVNVPQNFPEDQTKFPPEGTKGPYQFQVGIKKSDPENREMMTVAIVVVAAVIFLRK